MKMEHRSVGVVFLRLKGALREGGAYFGFALSGAFHLITPELKVSHIGFSSLGKKPRKNIPPQKTDPEFLNTEKLAISETPNGCYFTG